MVEKEWVNEQKGEIGDRGRENDAFVERAVIQLEKGDRVPKSGMTMEMRAAEGEVQKE